MERPSDYSSPTVQKQELDQYCQVLPYLTTLIITVKPRSVKISNYPEKSTFQYSVEKGQNVPSAQIIR